MKENRGYENLMCALLLLVGIIWGYGFICTQIAIDSGFSSILINLLRFAIASLFLFITYPKAVLSLKLSEIKAGALPAIFLSLGFFFQNLGQMYVTPGISAFVSGSYTILTPFITMLFFKNKPTKIQYLAAFITFVGISLLSVETMIGEKISIGIVFSILSAVSFALQFITLGECANKVESSMKMTFIQLCGAAIMFLIIFLIFDVKNVKNITDFNSGIMGIGYLGLLSSYLAYVVQTKAQKFIAPTKVAVIMSSECVFGALFSLLLGYDRFTVFFIVGSIISAVGIMMSNIPSKEQISKQ